jgi:hypothetical protein
MFPCHSGAPAQQANPESSGDHDRFWIPGSLAFIPKSGKPDFGAHPEMTRKKPSAVVTARGFSPRRIFVSSPPSN